MAMAIITIEADKDAWDSFVCVVHNDSGGKPEDQEARDAAAIAHLKLYMHSASVRHAEAVQLRKAEAEIRASVKEIGDLLAETVNITVSYNG